MIDPSQGRLSDKTQHAQEIDIRAPGGFRIRNLSKRAAADPRLRPSGPGIGDCEVMVMCLMDFWGGATAPQWARASLFTRFLDHTQRRTTVGRTALDK
jgi:hypothetical protein